ncbi:MAG TPA: iron-containing alcohol dehydrogenase, partial [Ottowia sp.]|nr:iron-containing alcohol dehydrogenase [Ottowia sp.]
GYRMFEFDVKLSGDGSLILMHDALVDRTTSGSGRVAAMTLADLARLDAGSWHSAAYAGEGVPTLGRAAAWLRANGLLANIEIKPATGHEAATGASVARFVQERWQGLPPLLSSFSAEALQAVKAKAVTTALENTVEATIYMSGVGAESGGLAAAHAIHNGMTAVHDLHGAQHGEKVAFGLVAQLVLEGAPRAELEQVIHIIKSVELPLTLADLGLKKFDEAEWHRAAGLACAEGETIHNEPFNVTPAMVYDAIVTADRLLQNYKD